MPSKIRTLNNLYASLTAMKYGNGFKMDYYGICLSLRSTSGQSHKERIQKYFKTWPKFSGSLSYPIKYGTAPPEYSYHYCDNMWDKKNPYCKLRYELLDHLINECAKEIDNETT